jgi:hypothetical protein
VKQLIPLQEKIKKLRGGRKTVMILSLERLGIIVADDLEAGSPHVTKELRKQE